MARERLRGTLRRLARRGDHHGSPGLEVRFLVDVGKSTDRQQLEICGTECQIDLQRKEVANLVKLLGALDDPFTFDLLQADGNIAALRVVTNLAQRNANDCGFPDLELLPCFSRRIRYQCRPVPYVEDKQPTFAQVTSS